jgi:putative inorganic carbon (HCO3(-)) transporter
MDFLFLVFLNAALFIRPAELIPEFQEAPLYNVLILICFALSFPAVIRQLTGRSLMANPISACVVGLLLAVFLSHLSHLNLTLARWAGFEFFKVVLYYFVIVAVVNSPARLCRFLPCLVGLFTLVAGLTLLHYFGIVTLPNMSVLTRVEVDATTGEISEVQQLQGLGIFADPNDLCLILVPAMMFCLYKLGDSRSRPQFPLWAGQLILFGTTLALTHSRGGFLALLAAILVLLFVRLGWKRTIPLAVVILPIMFVLFAGRQTNLEMGSGTAQSRIQLWSLSMAAFRQAPLFGIGDGLLADEIGQVSHNSFVQSYAEWGLFGGTLFLGMYYYGFMALARLGSARLLNPDPELLRLRPYLLAALGGYAAGMASLSRETIAPTYLMPALATVYLRLTSPDPAWPLARVDTRLIRHVVMISVVFLIGIYIYINIFVRWG